MVQLQNVIASPHIGAATKEAQTRVGAEVADIVITFADTAVRPRNRRNTNSLRETRDLALALLAVFSAPTHTHENLP